jgi:hypothetical protein
MTGPTPTMPGVARPKNRPKTLIEEATDRYYLLAERHSEQPSGRFREALRAMKKAADAMATAHMLATTWRKLGHRPTQAEYAAEWKVDLRTAERDFERWRQAFCNSDEFPGAELDIYTVAEQIVLDHGELIDAGPQAVGSLPSAALAA